MPERVGSSEGLGSTFKMLNVVAELQDPAIRPGISAPVGDGRVGGSGICTAERRIAEAKEVAKRSLDETSMRYERDGAALMFLQDGMKGRSHAREELSLCFGLRLKPMKGSVALLQDTPLSHELFGIDVSIIAAPLFKLAPQIYNQTKSLTKYLSRFRSAAFGTRQQGGWLDRPSCSKSGGQAFDLPSAGVRQAQIYRWSDSSAFAVNVLAMANEVEQSHEFALMVGCAA